MSNYKADVAVKYKDEVISNIVRNVKDVRGIDVVVYNCKLYPVRMDYKEKTGLYINLHDQLTF